MEKEIFIKYIEMLHRFEKLSKEELSIYPNSDEIKIMSEVRELVENNPELSDLLKKIHALPDSERMRTVVEYFANKEEKEEEPKTEEEEISKTFGVDVNKIEHKFLSNGNEIFSFYDVELGRQVLLENNQKGKSLVECLQEIQEQNQKYQTEDAEENSNNILRDKSAEENIELKMYTKEEIVNRFDDFSNVNKEDVAKLKFLLNNYEKLRIKGINLENLIYIDEDNRVHEVVVNEKQEVVVATPVDANYSADQDESGAEVEQTNESSDELGSMVEDTEKDEEADYTLSDGKYEKKEEEKEKHKTLTRKDDKYGFINNVLYVSIITAVVLVVCLIYFIIKYYA